MAVLRQYTVPDGWWWVKRVTPEYLSDGYCQYKRMYPNLLLSPPGPQLRLQALQVPQTPHWHSELEAAGGEEPPGDIIVSDDSAIKTDNFEFIGG